MLSNTHNQLTHTNLNTLMCMIEKVGEMSLLYNEYNMNTLLTTMAVHKEGYVYLYNCCYHVTYIPMSCLCNKTFTKCCNHLPSV